MARVWGGRLDVETGHLDLAVTVYDDAQVVHDLEANLDTRAAVAERRFGLCRPCLHCPIRALIGVWPPAPAVRSVVTATPRPGGTVRASRRRRRYWFLLPARARHVAAALVDRIQIGVGPIQRGCL